MRNKLKANGAYSSPEEKNIVNEYPDGSNGGVVICFRIFFDIYFIDEIINVYVLLSHQIYIYIYI